MTTSDEQDPQTLSIAQSEEPQKETWSECLTTEASIELLLPHQQQTPALLRQVTGPGAPRDCEFTRDEMVIGRSKAADFTIDSPELSRKHVKIVRDGQEYEVIDLGSRNGLYLNGIRIHAVVLRHGDAIQIGNVTFVFREGG